MDKKEEKYRQKDILNAGVAGASYEAVQRYGEAAKQHYVAYSGVDHDAEGGYFDDLAYYEEDD